MVRPVFEAVSDGHPLEEGLGLQGEIPLAGERRLKVSDGHPLEEGLGQKQERLALQRRTCLRRSSIRRRIRTFRTRFHLPLPKMVSDGHPLEEGLGLRRSFLFVHEYQ